MSIKDFYFVYLIVFLELVSLDTGIVGQNLDSETFNNHDNDTSYFCPDDLNFGECPCVIRLVTCKYQGVFNKGGTCSID